jgi:tetratricopeptide (TPR) repeat protein
MAVLIEAFSVVVRNSSLAARYPGGVEGYWRDCPNNTFCADDHLSRVGFMVQGDADVFVAQLAAKGLMPFRNGAAEDVALVSPRDGLLRPCDWLELGRWGKATIAWLAGTKRGDLHAPSGWNADRSVQYLTAEEAKERLEFVRSEGNVDVYRDRTTGQEYYVGRTAPARDKDRSRHNDLYKQACGLIEGLILLDDRPVAELNAVNRKRLMDSIGLFEEVVSINPGNWAAMWLLGKVYQRLGDEACRLEWFTRAYRLKPDQPDVAREAALAAMDAGQPEAAVGYCQSAIAASPDDAGLHANLAVALLFSGKPAVARTVAAEALRRDPADQITARIVALIDGVLAGKRPCPHHVRDL